LPDNSSKLNGSDIIGLDAIQGDAVENVAKEKRRSPSRISKYDSFHENMSPEDILAQVQGAAKDAADKVAQKMPNSKIGFLRQTKDGTTSLAILNPSEGVKPGTMERPVSLGHLAGKLSHGSGSLQGTRIDRRNIAKPVKPLYYGPFGSYAPSYDSTFANLTKEESALVFSTYGDETGVQYAESILDFAKNCDFAMHMVDSLLDILTGGEHGRTMSVISENKSQREGSREGEDEEGLIDLKALIEKHEKKNPDGTSSIVVPKQEKPQANGVNTNSNQNIQPEKIDIDALRKLSDLGIDTSFLDSIEHQQAVKSENEIKIESQLHETGDLLSNLEATQKTRLSGALPPNLSLLPGPSDVELSLASKITENLTEMSKTVTPGDLAPIPEIRKAMGISLGPISPLPGLKDKNGSTTSETSNSIGADGERKNVASDVSE